MQYGAYLPADGQPKAVRTAFCILDNSDTSLPMALPAPAPDPARAPDPGRADEQPTATWHIGVDVDLATSLALARAATRALLELSPLAHREMVAALEHEIEVLERQSDPLSLAAANAVRQYLPEAA